MRAVAHAKELTEAPTAGPAPEAGDLQPRLHRRQFVLGPRPLAPNDSWRSLALSSSSHLSYCRTLPVQVIKDLTGQPWCLIGLAFQSDPARPRPAEEIAATASAEVPKLCSSWSGRWILVGGGRLHLDACGLLGCFYHRADGDGALWVSSSAALLDELIVHSQPSDVAPEIRHSCGMDWYPPPRSRFRAISRLLPSQLLNLASDGELLSQRPLLADISEVRSYEEMLVFVERRLTTTFRNVAESHDALWLSLTGGRDSRTLLAAARRAGVEVTTYTYEKPLFGMRRGDRTLPPRLAATVGYEHRFIGKKQLSRELAHLFDAHTAGHCVDVDRTYFARRQWGAIPKPAIVLRGAVFGVGAAYYRKDHRFPLPAVAPDRARSIAETWKFERWHEDSFAHYGGIAEWVDWVERAPEPNLDWRDRLFREQREAGWRSSIEQGLDLAGYEIIHPANCHDLISAMMSIPAEQRAGKRHQTELIERMTPELGRFPINPPDPPGLKRMRTERNLLRRRGARAYLKLWLRRARGR